MRQRYINPFTDFGFKRLFGEEVNKDLLIDFLNALLQGQQTIRSLTYLKTEQLGGTEFERKAIFDLYCENQRGEKFIVELQRAKQMFFRERTIFYSTFPIRDQARPNDWDFRLRAVYTIAILDFALDDDPGPPDKYRYDVQLVETELGRVFYDKLTYIYLVMPKFRKAPGQLESRFEKWLYAIKHLGALERMPDGLRGRIFEKFFEKAEIAKFNPDEHVSYEASLKIYRDWKNTLDSAHHDGFMEGKERGLAEGMEKGHARGVEEGMEKGRSAAVEAMVRSLLAQGVEFAIIAQASGLREEEVRRIAEGS